MRHTRTLNLAISTIATKSTKLFHVCIQGYYAYYEKLEVKKLLENLKNLRVFGNLKKHQKYLSNSGQTFEWCNYILKFENCTL